MRILFTILSIHVPHRCDSYLQSGKKLTNELLEQTKHDIQITTNSIKFFDEFSKTERIIFNEINDTNLKLFYEPGYEFNYNLKYLCFNNIPKHYDYIIYLDCDMKINGWNNKSDEYLLNFFSDGKEACATRTCSILKDEYERYKIGNNLFHHKFSVYDIDTITKLGNDILLSKLPSEHFLIFKNIPHKIKKFHDTWKFLNEYLQEKNGGNGSYCDAFEIGISAKSAEFDFHELTWENSILFLKFYFNGNKL